ncbi:MAG: hypothetical protein LJE63_13350 [Desulfobacteraceae bacterium]|jgi:hypothetical protein|nr:hypothetical protein [Desulfobacteraceae bacterium]
MQTPLDTDNALALSRKWTLRAHGRQVVVVKKRRERASHVLIKAFIWALYLPEYPDLKIEVGIGGRYTPDVVQLDQRGQPVFWGEAERVSLKKTRALVARFPSTHLVFGKWAAPLAPFAKTLGAAVAKSRRKAPVDLIRFPVESAARFMDGDGRITIDFANLEWRRFAPQS